MAEQRFDLNAPSQEEAKRALAPAEAKDPSLYGVEKCCVHHFWAVIERDGSLVRGRNVARTAQVGVGQYEVYFTGDVSDGVYVATIGRPGIATEPPGTIGVALRCCPTTVEETNKGVWVDTHDVNGADSDRAFHLVVHT
jgi:hypothetical protein